jgi:hypothetical protein
MLHPSRDRRPSLCRPGRRLWLAGSLVVLAIPAVLLSQGASSVGAGKKTDPRGDATQRLSSAPPTKTIVDLQPYRQTMSSGIKRRDGQDGRATLINLSPNVNAWYLLHLVWGNAPEESYHLQNAYPRTQKLVLEDGTPTGLVIVAGQTRTLCALWEGAPSESLAQARKSGGPYVSLCGGKLFLLNPTRGHRTEVEAVTDFLRDEVPGGDRVVGFVRDTLFNYFNARKAGEGAASEPDPGSMPERTVNDPGPALLDPKQADRLVKPVDLGIEIESLRPAGIVLGSWYATKGNPGIYVSVIEPRAIAPSILQSYRNLVHEMDAVESGQLVYLVAFDLDRFDLRYSLGTDHPRVDWSEHILPQVKDESLPGPDGIATIAPLVSTGLISPTDAAKTVAAFTGGYKRIHGAFRSGPLAQKNHGSHYGFLERGVLFSTLQPGLATIYALNNDRVDMKTWAPEDNRLLPNLKYARENGVPLIDAFNPAVRMSVPGAYVNNWAYGNWSGSEHSALRTLRAGAAIQESGGKRFFIYAFFWNATPSAMTRVFQAYQCRYAMVLDMNALVHTYLAVYRRNGTQLSVQHLIQGMSVVDLTVNGKYVPRFLGYSDDRDFFYLTRKEAP